MCKKNDYNVKNGEVTAWPLQEIGERKDLREESSCVSQKQSVMVPMQSVSQPVSSTEPQSPTDQRRARRRAKDADEAERTSRQPSTSDDWWNFFSSEKYWRWSWPVLTGKTEICVNMDMDNNWQRMPGFTKTLLTYECCFKCSNHTFQTLCCTMSLNSKICDTVTFRITTKQTTRTCNHQNRNF